MEIPLDSEASDFLEHYEFLQRLAHGLLAGRDGAEDVVQEAWIVAHAGADAGAPRAAGWLRGVVRNLSARRRRSEARRRAREQRAARGDAYEPAESTLDVQGQVLAAVSALPAIYRTAIVLRYYHDLSPREIAAQLELPVETVKTRLKRGLERLRRRLDDRDAYLGAGGWVAALTATARVGAAPQLLGLGLLAMKKIVITLLALAALAAFLWPDREDEQRLPKEIEAGAAAPATGTPAPDALPTDALDEVVRTPAAGSGRPEDLLAGLPTPAPRAEPVVRLQLHSADGLALPRRAAVTVFPFEMQASLLGDPVQAERRFVDGFTEMPLGEGGLDRGYAWGVVQVAAEGFGQQRTEPVPIRWSEGAVSEVSLDLYGCRKVPVLVVHALTGEAVAGPSFMLEGPSLRFGNRMGPRETGVVELDLMPQGSAEDLLHVSGEGVATRTWTTAELYALPREDDGVRRLELTGGCTLRGVVELAAWQSIPDHAEVYYEVLRTGSGLVTDPRRIATMQGSVALDADGRFEIAHLPPCTLLIRLRDRDRNFMKPNLSPDYVVEVPATPALDWRMKLPEVRETLELNVSWGHDRNLLFADLYALADGHDRPYSGREAERTLIARRFWLLSGKDATLLLPEGVRTSGDLYLLRIGHDFDRRIERLVRISGRSPRLELHFGEAEYAEYPIPPDEAGAAERYDAQQQARQAAAFTVLEARD